MIDPSHNHGPHGPQLSSAAFPSGLRVFAAIDSTSYAAGLPRVATIFDALDLPEERRESLREDILAAAAAAGALAAPDPNLIVPPMLRVLTAVRAVLQSNRLSVDETRFLHDFYREAARSTRLVIVNTPSLGEEELRSLMSRVTHNGAALAPLSLADPVL